VVRSHVQRRTTTSRKDNSGETHRTEHALILGSWTSRAVRPIDKPRRGRLAVTKDGDLLLILPQTSPPVMRILSASKSRGFSEYEDVWVGNGYSGEPLIDGSRLERENVLSVFVAQHVEGNEGKRNVAVLDFAL
jgi:hypothetical protein